MTQLTGAGVSGVITARVGRLGVGVATRRGPASVTSPAPPMVENRVWGRDISAWRVVELSTVSQVHDPSPFRVIDSK